jgi:hypothetical protein
MEAYCALGTPRDFPLRYSRTAVLQAALANTPAFRQVSVGWFGMKCAGKAPHKRHYDDPGNLKGIAGCSGYQYEKEDDLEVSPHPTPGYTGNCS